jgi:predicted small lipoprotein YifL
MRFALALALAASLLLGAVGACGKRGPLEAPPDADPKAARIPDPYDPRSSRQ